MAAQEKKQQQRRKRMSAQVVTDEDYQLRHERVAGIDVAKAAGVVCLRLPPGPGGARRVSRTWEVPATVPDIEGLAQELLAAGAEKVSMESTCVISGRSKSESSFCSSGLSRTRL